METSWINPEFYPFRSNYLEIEGHQMHYLDEGNGPVILFSHGTPEWSFGWRDLIKGLRSQYRCIAPDLLGFGLSDKPAGADYSVEAHARRMEQLIEKLGIERFHAIGNDFGLSVLMYAVLRHPQKTATITLFNAWMWPLNDDPHYARPARWMSSWLGRQLYLQFNFPVNIVMPAAFGTKSKLTPEVYRHYKQALPSPASRRAAYAFSGELLRAGSFWAALWDQISQVASKPCLIFWGMKDRFIPGYELEKWKKALPYAQVVRFENAGHFVQEEEPEKMLEYLEAFYRQST